jgi:hypothetical protein
MPGHAFPAHQNILQDRIEGVSHMKRTRNIRRGYNQRKGNTVLVMFRFKIFLRDPVLIPLFLYALRRKAFF